MFWVYVRMDNHHGCSVVELHGELDLATGEKLSDLLAATVAIQKVTIVDLAGLDFVDCGGMRALVRAHGHAGGAGHALLLAAPGRQARLILKMTGTARLFSTFPSVAAAADCGINLLICA